jgi:hypothetical protein
MSPPTAEATVAARSMFLLPKKLYVCLKDKNRKRMLIDNDMGYLGNTRCYIGHEQKKHRREK